MDFHGVRARLRPDQTGLRLYTHNIKGRRGDWDARRRALRDGIQEMRPDLVSFQETIVTNSCDQVAEMLGSGFYIAHSRQRGPDRIGIAIASRWPIARVHELDLDVTERTGDFACTAMIAEVLAPHSIGQVFLVNHFPDYQVDHEHERELQAAMVARAIEALVAEREAHVLLAGDLDAEPDAASLRFLAGKQSIDGLSVCYRNAWDATHQGEPGGTFVPGNPLAPDDWPFQRIDHILIRCGRSGMPTLRIDRCELAFDQPVDGVWASDHFGLVADFVLPRSA